MCRWRDLTVGARVALNKQTLAVMGVLPPSLDPIVIGAEIIEKPSISYAEIGGLDEQIQEVREAVEDPLLRPELYKKVGIDPPRASCSLDHLGLERPFWRRRSHIRQMRHSYGS